MLVDLSSLQTLNLFSLYFFPFSLSPNDVMVANEAAISNAISLCNFYSMSISYL